MIFSTRNRNPWPLETDAFTLLEVLLAIVISVGMFFVVLVFYRQTAEVRTMAVREADRISAIRLVMQRMTAELQTVQGHSTQGASFSGDSNSLEFVRTTLPDQGDWLGGELGRMPAPRTDLLKVRYRGGGTNAAALYRGEEPLVTERNSEEALATLELIDEQQGRMPPVLSHEIRFVRFRFREGKDWRDTCASNILPIAIEITLGNEKLPDNLEMDAYPYEFFRRVILLPAGLAARSESVESNANEVDLLLQELEAI